MALPKALKAARRPEQTVDICFDESLVDRYRDLRLEQINDQSMAGGDIETPEMVELRNQIAEASVVFRLRSVSRHVLMRLVTENPPREGDSTDEAVGFNREDYNTALVQESIIEPELSDEDWVELNEILTPGQFTRLNAVANELAMASGHVPFSLSA